MSPLLCAIGNSVAEKEVTCRWKWPNYL